MKEIYGHLLAAFLVIASALCLIGYFVQVTQEDLCGQINLKLEATEYVVNGLQINRTYSVEESMKIERILANLTIECPEMQWKKYYHWHFLYGSVI